jgi:hypothetical protein
MFLSDIASKISRPLMAADPVMTVQTENVDTRPLDKRLSSLKVKLPLVASIPCAQSKSSILKSYTCYCIKVCK